MAIWAPDYYNDFSCIADKCKHSCCIGWEIDIDDASLERFYKTDGKIGEKLKENITTRDGVSYFKLCEDERCPFLDDNNLCELILSSGEDILCDICRDHPRFRNFFDSRVEMGLGLCCEAAGEIVLGKKDKTKIIKISGDDEDVPPDEQAFFTMRDEIFEIICDRKISIAKRVETLLDEFELSYPKKSLAQWLDLFLSLEMLDDKWAYVLSELKTFEPYELPSEWDIPFEQLLIYFIYRHTADCLYDGYTEERILFSILGYTMVYLIFSMSAIKRGEAAMADLVEVARMYSSEIEYSQENIHRLLHVFLEG